ncbi:hypothetical protein Hypma_001944 [Hypsizygus marmoreus]|uniref:Uncharacterized protein n=1 Tax=Hypsizygus marmoreus TaxID=39966 RepID=A0A369JCB5_HYPMA|nr:hypothetical protein Hypma_001944 [Hypsizygus marmoreus]
MPHEFVPPNAFRRRRNICESARISLGPSSQAKDGILLASLTFTNMRLELDTPNASSHELDHDLEGRNICMKNGYPYTDLTSQRRK